MDIREHRWVIHGGIDASGDILDDAWALDLTQEPPEWSELLGQNYARAGHTMVYHWIEMFGGQTQMSPPVFSNDLIVYSDLNDAREWFVAHNEPYGLDDPEKVVNTARIKQGDLVRIVASYAGDYFKAKLKIPSWVGPFTIEGDPYLDSKPGLYLDYSLEPDMSFMGRCGCRESDDSDISDVFPGEEEKNNIVISDNSGVTLRNLMIGHCDEEPPATPCIPSEYLSVLAGYTTDEEHFASQFVRVDAGVMTAAPTLIENCEFTGNGVGLLNICVSSAKTPNALATGCRFYRNFIGATPLETAHEIKLCSFEENYMTGIMLDKGAHTLIYDNEFIGNGQEGQVNDEWRSAIFSGFGITGGVPNIQHPLIYNNTFSGNYCAMRSSGFYETNQWLNMPVFFNNIVCEPDTGTAMSVADQTFTWAMSRNNCYYDDIDLFSLPDAIMQSTDDLNTNPLFVNPATDDLRLQTSSPCKNGGIYHCTPGISSEASISDYFKTDIGYHFNTEFCTVLQVENLHNSTDDTIVWEAPLSGSQNLVGYLIVWENSMGNYLGQVYVPNTTFYYEIDESLLGIGLRFGVSAYDNTGVFGPPVFIEM